MQGIYKKWTSLENAGSKLKLDFLENFWRHITFVGILQRENFIMNIKKKKLSISNDGLIKGNT